MKFLFLVLPELHLLDLAGPDQALLEAKEMGAALSIHYVGLEKNFKTSAGLPIGNLPKYDSVKLEKGDYLVIPGNESAYLLSEKFRKQTTLLNWIVQQHQKGVTICSICVGAFALAQAGLLNGLKCTTHFQKISLLQQKFPKALVQDSVLFTEENNIYTSAGIVSGIDLFLHIIEKEFGSQLAYKVARELVVYHRREGHVSQHSVWLKYRNHIHHGIHSVQDYILQNINKKHTLESLASKAFFSVRHFTRLFRNETGISVHDYIQQVKAEHVRQLLSTGELDKKEIAKQIGLTGTRQLNRFLKEQNFKV